MNYNPFTQQLLTQLFGKIAFECSELNQDLFSNQLPLTKRTNKEYIDTSRLKNNPYHNDFLPIISKLNFKPSQPKQHFINNSIAKITSFSTKKKDTSITSIFKNYFSTLYLYQITNNHLITLEKLPKHDLASLVKPLFKKSLATCKRIKTYTLTDTEFSEYFKLTEQFTKQIKQLPNYTLENCEKCIRYAQKYFQSIEFILENQYNKSFENYLVSMEKIENFNCNKIKGILNFYAAT